MESKTAKQQSANVTRDGLTATVTRNSATTYRYSVERHIEGRLAGEIVLSGDSVYEDQELDDLAEAHLDEAVDDLRSEFLDAFAHKSEIRRDQAGEFWGAFCRSCSDSLIRQMELGGADEGARQGREHLRMFPGDEDEG